jgi:Family of unknown function (DUF6152)
VRNKWMALSVIVAGFLILSVPVFAHHGAASYDTSKTITVTGTVTSFEFVNPHVLIAIEVKDASGKVETWKGELTSPNRLTRAGWTKSTLKPGDQLSMTGGPSKSGATTMWISKLSKNGEALQLGMGE